MRRQEAVTAVTGELFEKNWSKLRGSRQGLGRESQMTRAAMGHSPAIFKAIRGGGCHTKGQLMNQLEYLTVKSSHIVDSRSTYDGLARLDAEQIKDVAERFAGAWNERFSPKLGHTTHLLMAFPIGTRGEDVRDIAAEVCERFFMQEGRQYDYIVAIHEDRAHPHAHVVLNRRSRDGELFYLGQDHHFNYDDFRLAMVEAAERHSVRLEATRRIERGVATYAPSVTEVYQAKQDVRPPRERERVGKNLDAALAQIARHANTYRSLSAEATAENREDLSVALFKAWEMLARGGHLKPDGKIYMQSQHSFDELVSDFRSQVRQAEQIINDTKLERRAALERELHEVYQSVAHLNPLGERSNTLTMEPTRAGVYSEANIDRDAVDRLRDPQVRAQVETALRGTGILSSQVISRLKTGANNAALERQWLSDDLKAIAETEKLDLSKRDDLEKAMDRLDEVHVKLGTSLAAAEILRDSGVRDESDADNEAALNAYMEEESRLQNDPDYIAARMEEARIADGRAEIPERLALEAGAERAEIEGIVAENRRIDTSVRGRVDEVIAAMRNDSLRPPLAGEDANRQFRDEIERELDDGQLDRLRRGDETALERFSEDRLDQLYLAKTYLQSDEVTANSEVLGEVVTEIVDEEVEAQRTRHAQTHGEKGTTHG